MNYTEYKQHMLDNRLIESPESVDNLVNAIQTQNNIRNIKSLVDEQLEIYDKYSLNPNDLLEQFEEEKQFYIKRAIDKAYSIENAKEWFKPFNLYQMQIKELIKITNPRVAAIGVIDLKRQMGVS